MPAPNELVEQLTRAEELGYESAWVHDALFGAIPGIEPFTLLSYAAAVTSRIHLGLGVLVLPRMSPLHVAKMSASLDHLSGGRFTLGVGIGRQPELYPAFGYSSDRRVRRFEEGVQLIRQAWTQPRINFDGHFFTVKDAVMEPKPLQPHLPLIFGGHVPAAIRRAVRLGDGWMGAGSSGTPEFKDSLKLLREALDMAGVPRNSFHISKRVYIAVGESEATLERLQGWFRAVYGGFYRAEDVCIWGNDEDCAEQLAELAVADVDLIVLNPLFDFAAQSERLALSVIPMVSARAATSKSEPRSTANTITAMKGDNT
jgi:probable F420-dependent oxidoreductase